MFNLYRVLKKFSASLNTLLRRRLSPDVDPWFPAFPSGSFSFLPHRHDPLRLDIGGLSLTSALSEYPNKQAALALDTTARVLQDFTC